MQGIILFSTGHKSNLCKALSGFMQNSRLFYTGHKLNLCKASRRIPGLVMIDVAYKLLIVGPIRVFFLFVFV